MIEYRAIYSKRALDDLKKLQRNIAKRIIDKIKIFCKQGNPLAFAKKLNNPKFGTYRFRIGDYRVVFDIDNKGNIQILLILSIKHRKEIYKF